MPKITDKQRETKKRFIQKQRENGLCLECVNPVANGHSRCGNHLANRRKNRVENQQQAELQGYCARCYKNKSLKHNRLCEICYYKQTSFAHFKTINCWEKLKEKFESQNGKCALSGLPLMLGLNTDLDHITPKAKQGCNEIDNTQWLLSAVNKMKNNTLENDFFTIVEALYLNMKNSHLSAG